MQPLSKISKIIIHHSGNPYHTFSSIKKLHADKNKWEDIGYHWLIDSEGKILQGRSEDFQGAHVLGRNGDSLGICLIGDFDQAPPTKKQIIHLIKFLREKINQNNLTPSDIFFHRSFPEVTKTCPGEYLNLEEIRNLVGNTKL